MYLHINAESKTNSIGAINTTYGNGGFCFALRLGLRVCCVKTEFVAKTSDKYPYSG